MQAIVFCGLQASGKSSFYIQNFFNTHVRISLDLLRTRHRESLFLKSCLQTQMRFVVDNTNPSVAERQKYIALAAAAKYEVVCYYFETTVTDALERNKNRLGKWQVPEKGIYGTARRMQKPTLAEGFQQLFVVCPLSSGSFEVLPVQK